MLIGLFVPYYVIDYLFLPENPRICIDNYSSEDVKVYLNDTYVIDIEAQEKSSLKYNSIQNINGKFKRSNTFRSFRKGDYILYVQDNKGNVIQELNIELRNDKDYILNVLNKVVYEEGIQGLRNS